MPSVDTAAGSRFTRSAKIIAVADVVESVRLMEQDERRFIARWQRFVSFVAQRVEVDSGRVHKSLGDGLMLEFTDPLGCTRTLLAMQEWLRYANEELAAEEQVHLRIGAHLADYVVDKYDIYGTDVNLASRIASLAGPGEIVISAALRERLGNLPQVPLEDLGSCHLKHVRHPVHAYRLGPPGGKPVLPARPLSATGMRATLAVLPFHTDGATVNGVSGETLADELVATLARSDVLQVMSRMTTAPANAPRVAQDKALARYVLSGRARMHLDAMGLYAELADARSGHVVWAQSFEGQPRPSGTVDCALMGDVVTAVHAAVIQHEVEASQGQALPALPGDTLLLAAVGLMHRLSPVDVEQARGMLEHLMERWRRHASVHAWLAHLHVLRVQQAGAAASGHDQALARAYAASAVQFDPSSPLVLAVDGHAALYGAGNLEGAADRYAQALSMRHDHSLALLFRAELQAMQGAAPAARDTLQRALKSLSLQPLRYLYDATAALTAWAGGDAGEAAHWAEQALQRNPRYLPAWRTWIAAQVDGDALAQARAAQQRLLRRHPSFNVTSFLATTPLREDLAHRMAESLLRAGVPRT